MFSSRAVDQPASSTIEFDHRRSLLSISYVIQHNPLQFHLMIYMPTYESKVFASVAYSHSALGTCRSKQCLVRLLDLQPSLGPHRSVEIFSIDLRTSLLVLVPLRTSNSTMMISWPLSAAMDPMPLTATLVNRSLRVVTINPIWSFWISNHRSTWSEIIPAFFCRRYWKTRQPNWRLMEEVI